MTHLLHLACHAPSSGSTVLSYVFEPSPTHSRAVRAEGAFESPLALLACYSPFRHHEGHIVTATRGSAGGKHCVQCVTTSGDEVELVATVDASVTATAMSAGTLHGHPAVVLGSAAGELILLLDASKQPLPVVCPSGCRHSGPVMALDVAGECVISTSTRGEGMVWQRPARGQGSGGGARVAWGR